MSSPSSPCPPAQTQGAPGHHWLLCGCPVQESTARSCNRSTSFAVRLQVHDIQRGREQESLLRTLSFVGGGGVFCALAATFRLFLVAGRAVAVMAITLAMSPHDYVATEHCWLSVGPVLFMLTAQKAWGPGGRDKHVGEGGSFGSLTPGLQVNTCTLVRVVVVTMSSARRHAHMLSPQPCLQQQAVELTAFKASVAKGSWKLIAKFIPGLQGLGGS
uniref:Adhesion G protein-coupled receptor D2 n=1 Tax=Molossus molossus TaxID=27622 RepID=A0A7J8EBP3_MOLMO|nr:adhesion G protein-coupled receptor D2 [Molossus molossus]